MKHSSPMNFRIVRFAAVILGTGLFFAGCGVQSKQGATEDAHDHGLSSTVDEHDDHGHQHAAEGPHGGQLIDLDDGHYRAEMLHDESAQRVTIFLLDAETNKPAASDQTEITLQIFDDGNFVDYAIESVPGDAGEKGASQFATSNEKLSDALHDSDEVRGRLKVSIQGNLLTGIIEGHAHGSSCQDDDHDHGNEP